MKEEISQLIIRNLSDDVGMKASDAALYKSLYEITQKQLNEILNLIESNEELKSKFDEVKGQMTNGN
jgi:hypothetical protein|uniref:Uncharacterized protein n=2 Tax=unclassified Caudoviricetes TaxID=2788787 RepID=A0A8S5N8V0_9CAUD|nr:MAG TPA: hypothetical protein [Siphoviridae sp. ctkTE1]DAE10446.1 MAG TPA: hypothetical protein [Siphoviridae sp. ct2A828]